MAGLRRSTYILVATAYTFFVRSVAETTVESLPSTSTVSSSTAKASIPPSVPRVHLVKVGAGGFHFQPAELIDVSVGDTITFEFYPPDHSVARAEYGSACVPYEYTGTGKVGFWSRTQWVDTVSDITHWNLTINSTEPTFYYCAAPNSCKGELMVGVINPNGSQTLDGQIRAARNADFQVAPGEAVPGEASPTLAAPPTAVSTHQGSASVGHRPTTLSAATIVGIVLGGIIFVALCAALLFCVTRKPPTKTKVERRTLPGQPAFTHIPRFPPEESCRVELAANEKLSRISP